MIQKPRYVKVALSTFLPLDFWTWMIQLESIEHDYIRMLKFQYYKQMSS